MDSVETKQALIVIEALVKHAETLAAGFEELSRGIPVKSDSSEEEMRADLEAMMTSSLSLTNMGRKFAAHIRDEYAWKL